MAFLESEIIVWFFNFENWYNFLIFVNYVEEDYFVWFGDCSFGVLGLVLGCDSGGDCAN